MRYVCVVARFGLPSAFFTLNYNELKCVYLAHCAGKSVSIDAHTLLSDAEMTAIRDSVTDPAATARAAEHFVKNVIRNLLLRGVFGKITHFFFSTECQMKGPLHWHCLLWVDGVPPSIEHVRSWLERDEEKNKGELTAWASSICSESLPLLPERYDEKKVEITNHL